jgi:hypothetical protein
MKALVGILVLNIILFAAFAAIVAIIMSLAHEDSLFWNCYPSAGSGQALMGNHQCGDVDHILGSIMGRN